MAGLMAGDAAPSPDVLLNQAMEGGSNAVAAWAQQAPRLDETQARRAIERIRASASRQHHELLISLLQHPEPWVRSRSLDTLAALGTDGSNRIDKVLARLDDPTPLVREAAAKALVAWHDADVWPELIKRLDDSNPDKSKLAYTALLQQSRQSLPPERKAWEDWMQAQTARETELFSHFQRGLADGGNIGTAINGLASLDLMRRQATSVFLELVNHTNPRVRDMAERYLRQWTGCDGAVPLETCLHLAQGQAVAPPALPVIAPTSPTASASVVSRPAPPLSSTMRTLILITVLAGILAALVWFLRTPAGRKTKLATRRYVRTTGTQTAIHAIRTGTRRLTKPISVQQAAAAAKNAATGTKRYLRKKTADAISVVRRSPPR